MCQKKILIYEKCFIDFIKITLFNRYTILSKTKIFCLLLKGFRDQLHIKNRNPYRLSPNYNTL